MIIKELTLTNFQVIEKFEANFSGNVYFVTGDNELGKSTILKAIGALLTGNRDDVLAKGKEKGFAKMVVGGDGDEYEVELRYTKANPRGVLQIKQKSSGMVSSNVSMLQKVFGYTDYDAVEFSRWSETAEGRRKQIAVVKKLLPAKVLSRIEEIDNSVAELKDRRTDKNRDVKVYDSLCKEAAKGMDGIDAGKYEEPIDVTALMEQQRQDAQLIEKAKSVRAAKAQREEQLAQIPARLEEAKRVFEETVDNLKKQIEIAKRDYEDAVKAIEEERDDYQKRKDNAENWLKKYEANNPEERDVRAQLAEAEEHNRRCKIVQSYNDAKARLDKAVSESESMTEEIGRLQDERAGLVQKSKLPIEGLTFTEDGLELNGIPFVPGKVSDSQIMEVAVKLIIASNPTVKVFRIARGESLGQKRLQVILDLAKREGFQGFIESVVRGQEELTIEEYTEA